MPRIGGTTAAVDTPDMNVILGPGSDREVAAMLHVPVQ
jgi:hypothetical protein